MLFSLIFSKIEIFKDNIKKVKRLPKVKGIKEIMYPGQNKYKRYKMNFNKEIKISKIILEDHILFDILYS